MRNDSGPIVFDGVAVNVGNAWQDSNNCVVIPPAGEGTYYLDIMVASCYGSGTMGTLQLNGRPLITIYHNIISHDSASSRESAVIAKLVAGDTVSVVFKYSVYSVGKQTSFDGFRLA